MAEAIRIRLKVLAEHAATPARARDRHVREVIAMLGTEYEPARDYWKQPREAIRNSVGSRHTRRTLLSVGFKSKDPRRLKNYETARTEFVSWLDLYQPDSIWSPGVRELQLGGVTVIVNPDFGFRLGRLTYVVHVRYEKGSPLPPQGRTVITSLLAEVFDDHVPAILDLSTGEFVARTGKDREMLEDLATDFANRWGKLIS